jgi:hypothetical protein
MKTTSVLLQQHKCFVLLFVFLFTTSFFHVSQAIPEKLTQEQVLEELGVIIETKGKTNKHVA